MTDDSRSLPRRPYCSVLESIVKCRTNGWEADWGLCLRSAVAAPSPALGSCLIFRGLGRLADRPAGDGRLGARLRGLGGRRSHLEAEHPGDHAGADIAQQLLEHVERPALVLDQRIALSIGLETDRGSERFHLSEIFH